MAVPVQIEGGEVDNGECGGLAGGAIAALQVTESASHCPAVYAVPEEK